jgi:hypothetical protein
MNKDVAEEIVKAILDEYFDEFDYLRNTLEYGIQQKIF